MGTFVLSYQNRLRSNGLGDAAGAMNKTQILGACISRSDQTLIKHDKTVDTWKLVKTTIFSTTSSHDIPILHHDHLIQSFPCNIWVFQFKQHSFERLPNYPELKNDQPGRSVASVSYLPVDFWANRATSGANLSVQMRVNNARGIISKYPQMVHLPLFD